MNPNPGSEAVLDVVDLWEKPAKGDDTWRVPIGEVENAIRKACKYWA